MKGKKNIIILSPLLSDINVVPGKYKLEETSYLKNSVCKRSKLYESSISNRLGFNNLYFPEIVKKQQAFKKNA